MAARFTPEELSRVESARALTDIGERLRALAALTNEITAERAHRDGVFSRDGRLRAETNREYSERYSWIREALLADREADGLELMRRHRGVAPAALRGHRAREASHAAFVAAHETAIRRAGLSAEETASLLGQVRARLAVDEGSEAGGER